MPLNRLSSVYFATLRSFKTKIPPIVEREEGRGAGMVSGWGRAHGGNEAEVARRRVEDAPRGVGRPTGERQTSEGAD